MRALIASLIIALAVSVTGCAPSDDAVEDSDAAPVSEGADSDEGSSEE